MQVGEYTLHNSGGKGEGKGSGAVTAEPWHAREKKLLAQERVAREERLAKRPKGPGATFSKRVARATFSKK